VFARRSVPKQFAGHAKVYVEKSAIKIEEDLFASAANFKDNCAGQRVCGLGAITTRDQS